MLIFAYYNYKMLNLNLCGCFHLIHYDPHIKKKQVKREKVSKLPKLG